MPTLQWLSREEDLKTSSRVPYRLLEEVPELGYGDPAAGNLLIQGDNLEALKALLPFYAGQVKCIFIDPPYNTRSAFEHYDDNLEHAQWLGMMYPRLELLRELLREDGSIWVTIDDNEAHYLKVVMDEVFGRGNFVANLAWESRYSRSNDAIFSVSHNHLLIYAADPDRWKTVRNRLPRTEKQAEQYKNPDHDPRGPWRAIPWDAPNLRPNLSYPITTPTGRIRLPPPGRCWSRTEDQWQELANANLTYFGKSGDGAPSFKQFLESASGIVPNTWWSHEDAGHTDEAQKEISCMFNSGSSFATPKPERLIVRSLRIATNPTDLVLDSFLGSGTTAAVAQKMNRRYIGIELGEHAVTHCVPRLRKVIDGEQGGISKSVNWQGGGGFRFYRLGAEVFDEAGRIREGIAFPLLAAHVWFSETRTPLAREASKTPYLGVHEGRAYFLLYNGVLGDRRPRGGNVLTRAVLAELRTLLPGDFTGPWTVYGESTRLPAPALKALGITFKQTPYDVRAR